jgi:hypothetical protein
MTLGMKLQIPSTKLQRNFKRPRSKTDSLCSENWVLKFGASLDVGAWCLELFKYEPVN